MPIKTNNERWIVLHSIYKIDFILHYWLTVDVEHVFNLSSLKFLPKWLNKCWKHLSDKGQVLMARWLARWLISKTVGLVGS